MRSSGTLRRGTLAELLFEAEMSELTGTVEVVSPDRRGKVYVVEGRIAHARQTGQREFGDWLGLLGLIPETGNADRDGLAARLSTDLVINAPMIRRLAREYVDRVCADLLLVDEGRFKIHPGETVPHGVIERWKVAQVLLNAAATGHADKLETRPSLKDVRLKATTEGSVVLSRAEWRLAVEMARPTTPEALAQRVGAETRSVKRVLAGLLERDLLSAGPGAALVPPPSSTASGLATRMTSDAVAAAAEAADDATRRPAAASTIDDGSLPDAAQRAKALRRLLGSMRT